MRKLSGFGPGFVEHYTNAKKADAVTVLDEWVAAGKLSVRYLLRNPEHDTEQKTFSNLEEIPIGEWYDEFRFGDEFQIEMEHIESVRLNLEYCCIILNRVQSSRNTLFWECSTMVMVSFK